MQIRRLWAVILLLITGGTGVQAQVAPLRPVTAPDSLRIPERLPSAVALPSPEESVPRWEEGLVGRLSAAQATHRNWTEGGVDVLALTAGVQGEVERNGNSWGQFYETNLRLGFVRQEGHDLRKDGDRLRLSNSLRYRGRNFFATFNPTISTRLRTQFVAGYDYDGDPFDEGRDPPVKISNFLAPGTFTQTIGLTYESEFGFTQQLSVGAKEVVVVDRPLRTLYNVEADHLARYEAGLESTTEIDREIFERVHLQSTLEFFAAFNRDVPDMIWESLLVLEFNSWLSVDVELAVLYDRNISTALQVKEVVSVGASVEIL